MQSQPQKRKNMLRLWKNQMWGGKLACPCISEAACKVSMLKQVCRSGPEKMRCPITIFHLYSKCIYRRHSVRSGKKTSVIFTGHSLSGNRAMRSFLEANMETLWKSATPNIPKPSLCSSSGGKASKKVITLAQCFWSWYELIWITPYHFRRVGNRIFHGDKSKGTALSQMTVF